MRKRNTRDFVALSYRINALPQRLRKTEVLEALIRAVEQNFGVLPNGYDVDIRWRNRSGGKVRSDSLHGAMTKSRAGFIALLSQRFRRDYSAAGGKQLPSFVREAVDSDLELIDEESEEFEEVRRARESAKRKRRKRSKRSKISRLRKRKVSRLRKKRPNRKGRQKRKRPSRT